MTVGTQEVKTFEELKALLVKTKAEMQKGFDESKSAYVKTMLMKDLKLVEQSEELEVAIIGSVISGRVASKMIDALNKEIEELTELMNEIEAEKTEEDEEVTDEDLKELLSILSTIVGLEK